LFTKDKITNYLLLSVVADHKDGGGLYGEKNLIFQSSRTYLEGETRPKNVPWITLLATKLIDV